MLKLSNIRKVYPLAGVDVEALKSVSFEIPNGDYVALMGRSGSGKSTLLNILGCLDVPTSGDYSVDGQSVSDMDEDGLSRLRQQHFGFVFQHFFLVKHMDVLRNVMLPMLYADFSQAVATERATKLLQLVGLGDRMDHLPNQLSGGQQQRVAIARALANDPDTIIADEPTGALDSSTGTEILRLFKSLHNIGKRIIVVTHDSDVAAEASRTVHMRDGQVVNDELTQ